MAVIPTYTRQSGIPSTTGVSGAPVVLIENQVAQAAGNFFKQMGEVGDKLFEAQAASELTTATTNAQLKLVGLESDMAAQPGLHALGAVQMRSAQIYNVITNTMHPEVRVEFDKKWGILATKTQISIQATATKRAYAQMEGELVSNLAALVKGFGPGSQKIDGKLAVSTGIAAINLAVKKNIINPKRGVQLRLEFVQDVAENGVIGWLNRQTTGTMMAALHQMDRQEFLDPVITKLWSVLDENKKAVLTSRAIRNISQALKFYDKEVIRKDRLLEEDARKLMVELYNSKTDVTRRTKILELLAGNKTVKIGIYNTMLKDVQGLTNRFLNQKKSIALRKKILMTPWEVTLDDIVNYGGPDTDDMMALFTTRLSNRTKQAREIIRSAAVFVPANKSEARMKGEVFDKAQAEIMHTILKQAAEAEAAGKSFDPVAKANELIEVFEVQQHKVTGLIDAKSGLNALGIYEKKDVDIYVSKEMAKMPGISMTEMNQIKKWAGVMWPQ